MKRVFVRFDDLGFNEAPGLLVDGVGNVLGGPILLLSARHSNEKTPVSLDHLDPMDNKTVVKSDIGVGLELGKRILQKMNPHFSDPNHQTSPPYPEL